MGFQGLPCNRNDWYKLVQARLSEALIFQRFSCPVQILVYEPECDATTIRQCNRNQGERNV